MAGKRECPSCAAMVPKDHDQCFVCGYEFAGPSGRHSWRAWLAVILLIIFLIPFIRILLNALN
ncbi:MAG: hypothetical protein GF341_00375 [candidate division Zixibacteria bacterium]|nr:hypothetical protein [candidate division Zixibacteria bacterium]